MECVHRICIVISWILAGNVCTANTCVIHSGAGFCLYQIHKACFIVRCVGDGIISKEQDMELVIVVGTNHVNICGV